MRTLYTPDIALWARKCDLDPDWIEAQVLVESSGHTDAFRFEPDFYERYLKGKPEWAGVNPRRISSSYGLLQVIFVTAKEHGFSGDPEMLFVPRIGLEWGCRIMRERLAWAEGDLMKALAAYNGGKGAATYGPPYPNQAYVDKVFNQKLDLA